MKFKKRLNHFCVFNKTNNEYNEIKYLTQHELSEGWKQKIPYINDKKLINNFSVTLAFLPEQLWKKLKKIKTNDNDTYKVIVDNMTIYTIIETNQDDVMINLFNELIKYCPNIDLLNKYIDDLDISQHTSWLVLRAKNYINHKKLYNEHVISAILI